MESYRANLQKTICLDDLPGARCSRACELLRFLRKRRLRWFVDGSPSAATLLDLRDAGFVDAEFDDSEVVALWRVEAIR